MCPQGCRGSSPRFGTTLLLLAATDALEADRPAELRRARRGLDDRERAHAGARRHGIRRLSLARVEERRDLEPERLLAARLELFLARVHRLPGIVRLSELAKVERHRRAAIVGDQA